MKRTLSVRAEHWPAKTPFRIAGRSWDGFDLVVCELREGAHTGRGEAEGVFYLDETPATMQPQIASAAAEIEAGADRRALQELLPPGGARNALDCALWDLEARRSGRSVWQLAGVKPDPVTTVFTIGLEATPEAMATKARAAADRPLLKVKLNADRPVERIEAIRAARPDARLVADANGGWTFPQLREWAPHLARLGLSLLEQPLPRGGDHELAGYDAPLPLFADESCLHLAELDGAADRYDGIVIKLDKTGGLTEALALARAGGGRGLRLMVGCMVATSLSMTPAHVLAQLCEFVDIDGPLLLAQDRPGGLRYEGASVTAPRAGFWGTPT
ncbi:MAG TPA: N-acetyl-D-Glu racemase DgcA [Candidatus Binatia bacterium]|nr:N-acetyl-D-Glu racemase DgcA [Candidatus Binatia bacterium]